MGKDGYALRAELGKMTGRTSVPAIFVGGQFAGGCNDGGLGGIMSLESQGKLKGMRRQLVHMGWLRHPLGWRAAQPLSLPEALCGSAKRPYGRRTPLLLSHAGSHRRVRSEAGRVDAPAALLREGCRRGQGGSGIRDGATAKLQ